MNGVSAISGYLKARDEQWYAFSILMNNVPEGTNGDAKKVQENPLGSMLIAGGIGFALALLMTRPPRRPTLRQRYYG